MATATAGIDLLTVPEIGAEIGVADWAVRKTLDALGIAARVGRHRVIERGDLPLVVEELTRRGYIQSEAEETGLDSGSTPSGRSRKSVVEREVAGPATQNPTGGQPGGASLNPLGAGPGKAGVDERPEWEADVRGNFTAETPA